MVRNRWRNIWLSLKKRIKKLRIFKSKHLRLYLAITALAAIALIFLAFQPIFTTTQQKSVSVPYVTHNVKDSTLELNESKQKQSGENGKKTVTFRVSKSLFNIIFGGESNSEKVASQVTRDSKPQIMAIGTKKYQYMYCSNGTYRYYTDNQYKNPQIGFTSKSPDYCAQNKQGVKTKLADAPPHTSTSGAHFSYNSYSIPNCTTTTIPYGTDYKNVSWLPIGQTQTYPGLNGTYFSCLGTSVQPLNQTVYVGTGQAYSSTQQALSLEQQRATARAKCTADYNSARAKISVAGAGSSSAMDLLNYYYSQCLSAAG